jgi:hypothetical protein
MFRHSMGSAGRRSTRSARGSAKRRRSDGSSKGGGDGGLKRKFEVAAQRSAKKWVKIWRPPASNISFKVATWVPFSTLTEEERLDYEAKREEEEAQLKRQQQSGEEKEAKSQENSKGEEASKDVPASANVEREAEASQSRNLGAHTVDVAMSDQPGASTKRPMEASIGQGEEEGPITKRTNIEVPAEQSASGDIAITAPQDQHSTISQPSQPPQPSQEAQAPSELTTAATTQAS